MTVPMTASRRMRLMVWGNLRSLVSVSNLTAFRKVCDVTVVNCTDERLEEEICDGTRVRAVLAHPSLVRRDQAWMRRNLPAVVRDHAPDLIWATWGASLLPVVAAALRGDVATPIAYQPLDYPLTRHRSLVVQDALVFARRLTGRSPDLRWEAEVLRGVAARVWSGPRAAATARRRIGWKRGVDVYFPNYLSEDRCVDRAAPKLSAADGRLHVVFMGVDQNYYVWHELAELERAGLTVHARGDLRALDTPGDAQVQPCLFSHVGNPTGKGRDVETTRFVTQFDFYFVGYGLRRRVEQLANNLTTRCVLGLVAGVPILIRRGFMDTFEEIVRRERIGFVFDTADDLRAMLADAAAVEDVSRNAWAKRRSFTAERITSPVLAELARELGLPAPVPASASAAVSL
jgi:hypothetical protein